MGIKSTPFGSIVLTGDDIKKFDRQISRHTPNKAAHATVEHGKKLVKEIHKKGYATLSTRRATTKTG